MSVCPDNCDFRFGASCSQLCLVTRLVSVVMSDTWSCSCVAEVPASFGRTARGATGGWHGTSVRYMARREAHDAKRVWPQTVQQTSLYTSFCTCVLLRTLTPNFHSTSALWTIILCCASDCVLQLALYVYSFLSHFAGRRKAVSYSTSLDTHLFEKCSSSKLCISG